MSIPRGRYSFHPHAGPLAQITNEGLTATRKNPLSDFCNAALIGAQPLEDGKMLEVRIEKIVDKWSGSIMLGYTTFRPEAESLILQMRSTRSSFESLDIGDTVGIARVGRKLKFYINGSDQGIAEGNLPPVVYPMVDVYGKCTQVSIVSPGKLLYIEVVLQYS